MIVYSSTFGQIFICSQCRKIHLEFGNFSIDFLNEGQLENFCKQLQQIDGRYYADLNKRSLYKRKIMVPIPTSTTKMLFTLEELDEIKALCRNFLNRNQAEMVKVTRIEVDFNTLSFQHLN
jgi:hypothetical protein